MSSSSTASERTQAPPRIRAAELTDLDALVAIENLCFDTDRLSRRSFRHLLTRGRAATLVAERGGAVAGYVLVLFSHGALHARIYSLAVDPAARGQGLGRDLVAAAEDAAQDRECSEIRLEVRKDNEEAIGLYESLGYRRFGVLSDYYEDHEDAVRYRKSLAPQLGLDMVRVPYYAQTTDFTCGPAALMMAMGALDPDNTKPLDRKLELRLWREATTIFMMAGHGGCGPHGLALSAWHRGFGVEIYVNERRPMLLDSVRSPEKKEVMRLVQEDMIEELEAHGVPIHHRAIQPDELAVLFARGGIPLVLISSYRIYREKFPHWVVITGFDTRYVYVHDPFVDEEEGESIADCINMPIPRREFEAMSRYGRASQRAAVVIYPQREEGAAGD
jgi:ribosomal-protein-alanine acetyltransferase